MLAQSERIDTMHDEKLDRQFVSCRESGGTKLLLDDYSRKASEIHDWPSIINRSFFEFSRLESLELTWSDFDDAGLEAMASAAANGRLQSLRYLRLDSTQVTDIGLEFLANAASAGHFKKLEELHLSWTQITDTGIQALVRAAATGNLQQLETLILCHTRISDTSLRALTRAAAPARLQNLQYLYLEHTQITDFGVYACARQARHGRLKQLRHLCLGGTQVTDDGLKALSSAVAAGHLQNLEWLIFAETEIADAGLQALARAATTGHLQKLQVLILRGTRITDLGLQALARAVADGHLKNLHHLTLSDTQITDVGLRALATAGESGNLQNLTTIADRVRCAPTISTCKGVWRQVVVSGKEHTQPRNALVLITNDLDMSWAVDEILPLETVTLTTHPKLDDSNALSAPPCVDGRSVRLTASDEQIAKWFSPLTLGAWLKSFQVFWYVGRMDHEALMESGHAMGFNNLAKSLDKMRLKQQVDELPLAQNSIKQKLKQLQEAIAKTIPLEAWAEDEQTQNFRIDYFVGMKKEHQWTPRARKAWLYVDRLLQKAGCSPKWNPNSDVGS